MERPSAAAAALAVVTAARTLTGVGNAVMVSGIAEEGDVGPSQFFVDDGKTDLYAEAVDFAVMEGLGAVVVATNLARLILCRPSATIITEDLAQDFEALGVRLLVHGITYPGGAWFIARDETVDEQLAPLL